MKKSAKDYVYQRYKNTVFDEAIRPDLSNMLSGWPNLKRCVEFYFENNPEMKRYHGHEIEPLKFDYSGKFIKSLNKYCKTTILRTQFIDALTKIVYRIPAGGLCDTPIKERTGLWHFYVSNFWRVFYRKKTKCILLEEICPHQKLLYIRRY